MKRFVVVLLVFVLLSMPAFARWHHHRHHFGDGHYAADVAAGIVGTTAGVLLAKEILDNDNNRSWSTPRVYVVEPEGECYTVISRKTGKVTQKCVDYPAQKIIYVD